MNQPTITYLPIFNDNPDNPARCEVKTGKIQVNNLIYSLLPDYQKEFVLQHELGHYYRQSYNEVVADQYALEQLKLQKPNSLWNFVKSVRAISHEDPVRCYAAEQAALQVAADKGSDYAKKLLKNYQTNAKYASADGGNASVVELPIDVKLNPMYILLVTVVIVCICIVITSLQQ